jgi:hypothetical protein
LKLVTSPPLGEVTSRSPKALMTPGRSLKLWFVLILHVAVAGCIPRRFEVLKLVGADIARIRNGRHGASCTGKIASFVPETVPRALLSENIRIFQRFATRASFVVGSSVVAGSGS